MNFRNLIFLLPLFIYCPMGAAEIYRWIDNSGRVQFGENAPENSKAEVMDNKLQDTGNFLDYPQLPDAPTHKPNSNKKQAPSGPTVLQVDIQLIDYTLPDDNKEQIHNTIQGIYTAYTDWFGWPNQPRHPITIKIFGSVKSFENYQRKKGKKVRNRSYYSGEPDREIVMKGTHPESTVKTLYHETSHAILHMQQPATAKWLNEGLAEVFSTVDIDSEGYPVLALENEWAFTLKKMQEKGSLRKIEEYLSITSLQWKKAPYREERSYYMIAWSILYFLVNSEDGLITLKMILEINRLTPLDGKNLIAAIDETYPGGITQLDNDWRTAITDMN